MAFIVLILLLTLCINCINSTADDGKTYLLFANRNDIRLINADNPRSNTSIFSSNLDEAAAVDFYHAEETVFWTDIGLEMIRGLKMTGPQKSVFTVVSSGIMSPDGLACDWVTRKIYWADSETNRIEVVQFDGKNRKVLFWKDLDQPRALAVVPKRGYIFWTDWGEVPKIERASMDGDLETRVIVVKDQVGWPNGLTVDYEENIVYWADARIKKIEAMDYDGNNRKVILADNLPNPYAVTVTRHHLFWTDWATHSINRCNKTDGTGRIEILGNPGSNLNVNLPPKIKPVDIHAYSAYRQPSLGTPCLHQNGGCSHLCLLSASHALGYSCGCPTGVRLLPDSKTCASRYDEVLILARRDDIRTISLDTPDHTDIVIPLKRIKHAIAVDYDVEEDWLYWTDNEASIIRRSFLNGSSQEDVISFEVSLPEGIAIDWISRNIYWTDTGTKRIEVARMNGAFKRTIIHEGLREPRAIIVHPKKGHIYWSDWGEPIATIERASLDGSNREVIISENLKWPNSIVIDYETEMLFWCDAHFDQIETSDLNGGGRKVIVSDNMPHVFGLSISGEWLYWTDWLRRSVERVHKTTGSHREVISDTIPDLMGVKAVSIKTFMKETNSCTHLNGNCSQLCFPLASGRICSCTNGDKLKTDGINCEEDEFYVPPPTPKPEEPKKSEGKKRTACHNNNGGCSHICQPPFEGKGRKCSCPEGLFLSADDKTCVPPVSCHAHQFQCRSGSVNCIPLLWVCNEQEDCKDGSDEINCPECHPPHYKCPTGGRCINPTMLCDNVNDCPDGSDESCCASHDFMCRMTSRTCVHFNSVCDQKKDCPDGNDESIETCGRMAMSDPLEPDEHSGPTYFIVILASILFLGLVSYTVWYFRKKVDPLDCPEDLMMSSPLNISLPPTLDYRQTRRIPMGLDLLGSSTLPLSRLSNEHPYIDRSVLTAVSSTSSSTVNHYPKETLNPPPSPVTDQSQCHYDTSNSSQTASRSSARGATGFNSLSSRKRLIKSSNHHNNTPCTSDVAFDDSDTYGYRGYYSNSHVDVSYDSGAFPPPPTPYMSEFSSPPSPCTERSFVNPCPNPPPSPVL